MSKRGSNDGQSELSPAGPGGGGRSGRGRAFRDGYAEAVRTQEASGRYFKGPTEAPEEVIDAYLERETEARD